MPETKKKILYLEDDEFTRLMVQSELEHSGFSVESFSTYTDAATALKEKTYDLILTDLNIEGQHAEDLIRNLKALGGIPIVVLSASQAPVKQADLAITKPLTADKIQKITQLVVNGSGSPEVDLSKVYQFACGDAGLVAAYVHTFVENYEKDLSLLRADIAQNDIKGIKQRSHKMLSSVSYYSNQVLNKLLQTLELQSEQFSRAELQEIFREVEEHSRKLLQSVQQKING